MPLDDQLKDLFDEIEPSPSRATNSSVRLNERAEELTAPVTSEEINSLSPVELRGRLSESQTQALSTSLRLSLSVIVSNHSVSACELRAHDHTRDALIKKGLAFRVDRAERTRPVREFQNPLSYHSFLTGIGLRVAIALSSDPEKSRVKWNEREERLIQLSSARAERYQEMLVALAQIERMTEPLAKNRRERLTSEVNQHLQTLIGRTYGRTLPSVADLKLYLTVEEIPKVISAAADRRSG